MSKHTKEKWITCGESYDKTAFMEFCSNVWDATQVNGDLSDKFLVIQTENQDRTIAIVGNGPASRANARIIAKAPEMLGAIKAVTDVLDTVLGDTDPEIDDDWTEEEIRDEYPIMWCMQQLTKFVNKSPEGGAE